MSLEQRCNHYKDCPDNSDEFDCKYIKTEEDPTLKDKPPLGDQSDSTGGSLEVMVNIKDLDIIAIEDVAGYIMTKFMLELSWLDKRLTYINLHEFRDMEMNAMGEVFCIELKFIIDNITPSP